MTAATDAVVVMVRTAVAPEPPGTTTEGVTVAGVNEHVLRFGRPEHVLENVTGPEKPGGLTVIVYCASCPALTVCVAGVAVTVKSLEATTVNGTVREWLLEEEVPVTVEE